MATTPTPPTDDIFLAGGRLRSEAFDEATLNILKDSVEHARTTRWDSVRSPHVFMGLLGRPDAAVRDWANRLGADLPCLLGQFKELFQQDASEPDTLLILHREFLSDNVIRLLREAYARSTDNRRRRVTPMDLLISLFTVPNSIVAECFERVGLTAAKLTELAVMAEQAGGRTR